MLFICEKCGLAASEIFELLKRGGGGRLYNLVLSSFKFTAQMRRKRNESECDFYAFIRLEKVENDEVIYTETRIYLLNLIVYR